MTERKKKTAKKVAKRSSVTGKFVTPAFGVSGTDQKLDQPTKKTNSAATSFSTLVPSASGTSALNYYANHESARSEAVQQFECTLKLNTKAKKKA